MTLAIHLVLGGARSGKSAFAAQAALTAAKSVGLAATFVATGTRTDDEMAERIQRHQRERSSDFTVVEVPLDLERYVTEAARSGAAGILVIDCLATHLGNLFHAGGADSEAAYLDYGAALCDAVDHYPHMVYVVTNEVGLGIVPAFAMGRNYRDALGRWNAVFAEAAGDVTLMLAGLPLALKRNGRQTVGSVEE